MHTEMMPAWVLAVSRWWVKHFKDGNTDSNNQPYRVACKLLLRVGTDVIITDNQCVRIMEMAAEIGIWQWVDREMVKSLCPLASLLATGVAQTLVNRMCPDNFCTGMLSKVMNFFRTSWMVTTADFIILIWKQNDRMEWNHITVLKTMPLSCTALGAVFFGGTKDAY